jgi:hypothetical protein
MRPYEGFVQQQPLLVAEGAKGPSSGHRKKSREVDTESYVRRANVRMPLSLGSHLSLWPLLSF